MGPGGPSVSGSGPDTPRPNSDPKGRIPSRRPNSGPQDRIPSSTGTHDPMFQYRDPCVKEKKDPVKTETSLPTVSHVGETTVLSPVLKDQCRLRSLLHSPSYEDTRQRIPSRRMLGAIFVAVVIPDFILMKVVNFPSRSKWTFKKRNFGGEGSPVLCTPECGLPVVSGRRPSFGSDVTVLAPHTTHHDLESSLRGVGTWCWRHRNLNLFSETNDPDGRPSTIGTRSQS